MTFNIITQETFNEILNALATMPAGKLITRTILDESKFIKDNYSITITENKKVDGKEPIIEPVQ